MKKPLQKIEDGFTWRSGSRENGKGRNKIERLMDQMLFSDSTIDLEQFKNVKMTKIQQLKILTKKTNRKIK
jgi:hypothetical protein